MLQYQQRLHYTKIKAAGVGGIEEKKQKVSSCIYSCIHLIFLPLSLFLCFLYMFFSSFHQVVYYLMQCHYIVEIAAVLQFSRCHPARYVSLQQFAFVTPSGMLKISSSFHVEIWKIASHRDELNQLVIPIKINVFLERADIWGINQNLGILSFLSCCQNSELLQWKSWVLKWVYSVYSPFWSKEISN